MLSRDTVELVHLTFDLVPKILVAIEVISSLDLPPFGPSLITRVCRLDFGIPVLRRVQARQGWSPQIAQTSDALAVACGFSARNAV
jgi:hypothetical protein